MTVETTIYLPCNEGTGTTLTNTAGPGTKQVTGLDAAAWSNFNASTRSAVRIVATLTDQDAVNETPYSVIGNSASPAPYNPMCFVMVRFEGAQSGATIRPAGRANAPQSVWKAGINFTFNAGSQPVYTTPFSTVDTVFAVGMYTEGLTTELRTVWAVIEYDPADWSVRSTNSAVTVQAEPDAGAQGWLDNGGTSLASMDLISGGGDVEMYGLMHARVAVGSTPAVASSASAMQAAVSDLASRWQTGDKVLPASLVALASAGSARRNRARRAGNRR